jgi:probable HAF family extracellular repeat protein
MAARSRVFIYRDSQVLDLGTFGGQDGVVAAINAKGQLVGQFGTEPHADYADHHGFLLDKRRLTDLGSLGGRMTTPTDINDSSQVVGYAQVRSGENHAFLYRAGRLTDLGTLPAGHRATPMRSTTWVKQSGHPIPQRLGSSRWSSTVGRSGISTV